jgi:hypothetical protein
LNLADFSPSNKFLPHLEDQVKARNLTIQKSQVTGGKGRGPLGRNKSICSGYGNFLEPR